MTKNGFVTGFLAYLVETDCVKGTVANYRANLTGFFGWLAGQDVGGVGEPAHVTPLDVREYRQWLQEQGYMPGTINKKLFALRKFFDWCIAEGRIASNPLEHIKGVEEAKRAPRWLERRQVYRLLRAAVAAVQLAEARNRDFSLWTAVRTWATIVVMLNTGLRVSELCNLDVGDVQLEDRAGWVVVRRGKGNKYREVPLNVDTRQALKRWLKIRSANRTYLFVTNNRQRMTRQVVHWHINKIGAAAGVQLSPHTLRHTFGKNLVNAGVPLDQIAVLMGHSNVNTTAIYTCPGQADLQQAVDLIAWGD